MVKNLVKYIILLLLAGNLYASGEVTVKAYTDTDDYFVGDYIKYTIEVSRTPDAEIILPAVEDSLSMLEFIRKDPVVSMETGEGIFEYHHYYFSKYDSTDIEIPALPVQYKLAGSDGTETLFTNEVLFVVRTMEVNTQEDIRDVKAPLTIALEYWFWIIIAAIILILLIDAHVIYTLYFKKRRKKEAERVRIIIPPHKTAIKDLMSLEDKKLWQQGKVKEFHTEITAIIRTYFEGRFSGFHAMEMTSGEIIEQLKNLDEIQPAFDNTRKFFENADMVKFAKFEPMPTVNEEMMKQGYEIVKLTVPVEKPVEEKTSEDKPAEDKPGKGEVKDA